MQYLFNGNNSIERKKLFPASANKPKSDKSDKHFISKVISLAFTFKINSETK